MQDARADMTEIHLPERWAVLEKALRQLHAENAAQPHGSVSEGEGHTDAEALPLIEMR